MTQTLLDMVDADPFLLEQEAEKVSLFYAGNRESSIEDIVCKSVHATIWEYLHCVMKGDKYGAARLVRDLLGQGENEYSILGMIVWNIKIASVIKAADHGSPSADHIQDSVIARDFGYNPYVIRKTREYLPKLTLQKLTFLYERLIELDVRIKAGTLDPQLGLLLLSFAF